MGAYSQGQWQRPRGSEPHKELSDWAEPLKLKTQLPCPTLRIDLNEFNQRTVGIFANCDIGEAVVPCFRARETFDALRLQMSHIFP